MTGRRAGRRGPAHDSEGAARAWTPALVAVGVVVVLGCAAGVAVVAGVDGGDVSAAPAPTVTVTAETARTTAPITASSMGAASPMSSALPEPGISVSPSFDLAAHSIDDPESIWAIVNKHRPIDPQSWSPDALESIPGGGQMTPEAAQALRDMRAAATEAGAGFSVGTAFRSYGVQQGLYTRYVGTWGSERADTFSARPGYSEHQTGLAADIYQSAACRLKPCFGDEAAGLWVAEHGHEYGFHLRYPEGSTDVTGYRYEPWHIRYVGVELATYLHEEGIATLEEAFGLEPAPDYP